MSSHKHRGLRTRSFMRAAAISQLIAAFALWFLPLAHALQAAAPTPAPTVQAAPAELHAQHTAHGSRHAPHAPVEAAHGDVSHAVHEDGEHGMHQFMQCDCLLCKLLHAPALPATNPYTPARAAPPAAFLTAASQHPHAVRALRPPERGPPAFLT